MDAPLGQRTLVTSRVDQAAPQAMPPSLHPVVDSKACICSGACIEACPEGGILAIERGKAVLVGASRCIGHGQCAVACPVDAIKLVFGTSERGVDLPELGTGFHSSRPGVHVVGELGGMGLIKNALRQGLEVAHHLAETLRYRSLQAGASFDVVIVGAGPAGLAAALGCRERNLHLAIIDQSQFGGTVSHYPRHKVVMTESVAVPYVGRFGGKTIGKEELLSIWQRACLAADIDVMGNTALQRIDGNDGDFQVVTSRGTLAARKVIVACGRRGSPRKLEVPGEEQAKVAYQLVSPEQYAHRHVLVVGGGDSALETAIMLCDESDAEVSLSYRGPSFARARPANIDRCKQLLAAKRLHAYFNTTVARIDTQTVTLAEGDRSHRLANDFVIVQVGGSQPEALLQTLGIRSQRHTGVIGQPVPGHSREEQTRKLGNLYAGVFTAAAAGFCLLTTVSLAVLAYVGKDYYGASLANRVQAPLHFALRPAGSIGKAIGAGATWLMLLNFAYLVRKRVRVLHGFGELRDWLNLHMAIGLLTPLVVAFHAAFQSNNVVAKGSIIALVGVIATGIVGRFIYSLAPTANLQMVLLPDLVHEWERLRKRTKADSEVVQATAVFARLDSIYTISPAASTSVVRSLSRLGRGLFGLARDLWRARSHFASRRDWGQFALHLVRVLHLRAQIEAYEPFRQLLGLWRGLHVALSIFLLLLIGVHIALVVQLGYSWRWH